MKTKVCSVKEKEFYAVLEEVLASDYFNLNGEIKILEDFQDEALEDYGGFLALVPSKDYPQVAFDVLQAIYHFNLSHSHSDLEYTFYSMKMKTAEKNAVLQDIKRAKKYRETIENSPSQELKKLVDLNIKELQQYIKFQSKKSEQKDIIEFRTYTTLGRYQYEDYKLGDKFTKKDIGRVLENIVQKYNITVDAEDIKNLKDKL